MTPKEKAQDLWVKYYERIPDSIYTNYAAKMEAKYFALIAVDEIIEVMDYDYTIPKKFGEPYWVAVKKEIEKL